jgi:flavin prenyltransferase
MPRKENSSKQTIILGVTGASGAIFARRMLALLEADKRVGKIHLVISGSGLKVLREELEIDVSTSAALPSDLAGATTRKTEYLLDSDIGASIASGSYKTDGMVVIPCSTGCLAQIANGISQTLIERAADVCLKERRPVILAVRDSPFSRVHLVNMLRAQEAGAVIFPVIPAYYHRAATIEELATQFCCRVLAQLGLEQETQFRWKGQAQKKRATSG